MTSPGRKKNNIRYIVTQSFLGSKKAIIMKGYVDKVNDGTFMAEHHIVMKGKKMAVGTFHQKYLTPSSKDTYLMYLEEYDAGRFRPLVYDGEQEIDTFNIETENKDTGKKEKKEIKQSVGKFKPIPNEDFDWLARRKDKNRLMLEKKEKNKPWQQYLVAGALLFLVILGIFIQGYFNYEGMRLQKEGYDKLSRSVQTIDPGVIQENTLNMIFKVLKNETIREAVKPPIVDENAPPK